MYKKFFGLSEDPFNVSPDPRFLFRTAETDETFANLLFGVEKRKGLILLTGEVGTGKTILLKKLVERFHGESTASAFVFNPRLNPTDFLDYVLSDFGLDHDSKDKLRMLRVLYAWLLERHRMGQTSVLIVDEAQNLSTEVLEEIRLLSNVETPTEKLLQIILSGQPEIEEKLKRPELRPLRQRIALRRRTRVLSLVDTSRYVAHRLRVAGGDVETIFTPEAIANLYRFSQGIPRLINLLCQHAFISAYADQRKPVGAETIEEVAQQFELSTKALPYESLPDEEVKALQGGALARQPAEITKRIAPQTLAATKAPLPVSREIPKSAEERASARLSAEAPLAGRPAEIAKPIVPPTPATAKAPAPLPRGLPKPAEERVPARTAAEAVSLVKQGREGSTSAVPVIPATPLDGTQLPSGGARPGDKNARRPLPPKKDATGPLFASLNHSTMAKAEVPKTLEWALLALVTMGVVLGGYYITRGGRRITTSEKEAASSKSQPSMSAVSPANVSATTGTSAPSGLTEEPGQKPLPTQPETKAPSDRLRQITVVPPPERTKAEPPSKPPSPPPRVVRENPEKPKVQELARSVAPAATAPSPSPPVGQLFVMSNVPGATITVNGRSEPDWVTPHTFADLPPGSYSVVVSRQGYRAAQQSARVDPGQMASVNATLSPPSGEIEISTNPPGAEVLIGGKSYGPSPVRATVAVGQHSFLARQAGREPVAGSLTVQDGTVVTRNIDLPLVVPAPPRTNVEVTTNPPKATVYADGAPLAGETPTSFHLSPGHHTLIIFAAGYRPIRREIEVPESATVAVSETLAPQ